MKMNPHRQSTIGIGVLAAALLTGVAPVAAQPADHSFHGKTITVVIGFHPGGGYDFFGRLYARHAGRHLPGQPNIVPQNMPGAAGLAAANHLYSAAPRDGTMLGIVSQSLALAEALETPGIRFKAAEFNWVGRLTSNVEVNLVWHTSKVKSIEEAKQISIPIAGTSPGSAAYDYPAVLNGVVGTKFKIIGGYQSAAPMLLSMERGETEGAMTSWNTLKTSRQAWLKENKINILVQYAKSRHPDLPNIPTMVELGQTVRDRQVLSLYASGALVGRSILAPPDLGPEIVSVLRASFQKMLGDPAFLTEVEKTKAEFDPMPGEELQKVISEIANVPPDVLKAARVARGI